MASRFLEQITNKEAEFALIVLRFYVDEDILTDKDYEWESDHASGAYDLARICR
jgi:hypothetical protein